MYGALGEYTDMEKQNGSEKNLSQCHFSTKDFTGIGMSSNQGLHNSALYLSIYFLLRSKHFVLHSLSMFVSV
jgi:hypothetical protein